MPFCFTSELSEGLVGTLVDEIISFVDELDPERYAGEWLEASGQVTPTRYLRAVADMDDIRTHAWLLAFDLSELAEKQNLLLASRGICGTESGLALPTLLRKTGLLVFNQGQSKEHETWL